MEQGGSCIHKTRHDEHQDEMKGYGVYGSFHGSVSAIIIC